jgi:Cyclic nucleotide-binding domain/Major Facilitator Superfamily
MIESGVWPGIRKRLGVSARAFSTNARNRNLRRAQLSFGAAWTAEWALMVVLGVVAYRDGGAEAAGIVAFARMAPAAFIAPLGTALADRFPRDRVLLWSCVIRAAATGAAAVALAAGSSVLVVYALAVVATAAFTIFRPAHSALLPGLCMTPLELTSANVVRGLVDSVSTFAGPLLAALLLGVASAAAALGAVAALALVSGLALLRLSYEAPPRGRSAALAGIAAEIGDGFRALIRYRDAGLLTWLGLAQTFTRGALNVFVVVIAIQLLGAGAPGVGLLTAAVGAGAVGGSLGASLVVGGRRLATIQGVGVALWGLPLALVGAFQQEPVVLALMAVIGIGNALVDIGLFTLLTRLVPETLLARVMGAFESLVALTVALGSLVTPFAIDLLGVRGALVAIGCVAPLSAALGWRRLRAIDSSIEHRDAEIEVLKKVGMFRPLPMAAIDGLAVHVDHAEFAAGQAIFNQGDHGDRFYVIATGEADVIGDGRLVNTIGPGDGFGEIALLRGTSRTTTVCARTTLRVYTLERGHFLSAIGGYRSSSEEADALITSRLAALALGPDRQ